MTDVGVMLALGSMSLPYVTSGAGPRSAPSLGSVLALVLLAAIFAITLVPDRSRPLPRLLGVASGVLAVVATLYAVVQLLDAVVLAGSVGGRAGTGPWLLLAGCLVTTSGVAAGLLRPEGWRTGAARDGGRGSRLDENPFGEPLFDSLELEVPPAVRDGTFAGEPDVPPTAEGRPATTLAFEAERAAARVAEDEGDRLVGG